MNADDVLIYAWVMVPLWLMFIGPFLQVFGFVLSREAWIAILAVLLVWTLIRAIVARLAADSSETKGGRQ